MKKKHLQTRFIQFLLERYKDRPNTEETDIDIPLSDDEVQDEEDTNLKGKDEDEEPTKDDIVIEGLLKQYKKLKRQYESIKVRNRQGNSL